VDTRKGVVKGHVSRVSASPTNGTRTVHVALDGALPEGVAADSAIDATIDIEKLEDIPSVGRPIHAAPNSSASLFKLVSDGTEAVRVTVKFGRASVQSIEVLDGLKPGDQIILSDMSAWEKVDRIHLQ
jgi:HlyD family secretion protein